MAVWIEDVQALPGDTVALPVRLTVGDLQVIGVQADIVFDPKAPIAQRSDGSPDCVVNPEINKEATQIRFQPSGCEGSDCTSVRAFVFSLQNRDPIADGAVLFACNATVAADAPAQVDELLSDVILSDADGSPITDITRREGQICVLGVVPLPTTTPTP